MIADAQAMRTDEMVLVGAGVAGQMAEPSRTLLVAAAIVAVVVAVAVVGLDVVVGWSVVLLGTPWKVIRADLLILGSSAAAVAGAYPVAEAEQMTN